MKKNIELFQGEKYLNKNKNYFEGWYFKNSGSEYGVSFIPGININGYEKKTFIQIITNDESYNIDYDIDDFVYNDDPFYIKIKDSYFSKEYIDINIETLKIYGRLNYSNSITINKSILNPNIMGPFSYIPFMECNHAILSMKNKVNGVITINDKKLVFDNGDGYIEKDFGISFPKSYIWIQGNSFKDEDVSFMLSIAHIPFKIFSFKGFICSLIIDNKEYRFATYNNSKIIKCDINDDSLNIILKKHNYLLEVKSLYKNSFKLKAPNKGEMNREIFESITSNINIILKENNKIIFCGDSTNAGLEVSK